MLVLVVVSPLPRTANSDWLCYVNSLAIWKPFVYLATGGSSSATEPLQVLLMANLLKANPGAHPEVGRLTRIRMS